MTTTHEINIAVNATIDDAVDAFMAAIAAGDENEVYQAAQAAQAAQAVPAAPNTVLTVINIGVGMGIADAVNTFIDGFDPGYKATAAAKLAEASEPPPLPNAPHPNAPPPPPIAANGGVAAANGGAPNYADDLNRILQIIQSVDNDTAMAAVNKMNNDTATPELAEAVVNKMPPNAVTPELAQAVINKMNNDTATPDLAQSVINNIPDPEGKGPMERHSDIRNAVNELKTRLNVAKLRVNNIQGAPFNRSANALVPTDANPQQLELATKLIKLKAEYLQYFPLPEYEKKLNRVDDEINTMILECNTYDETMLNTINGNIEQLLLDDNLKRIIDKIQALDTNFRIFLKETVKERNDRETLISLNFIGSMIKAKSMDSGQKNILLQGLTRMGKNIKAGKYTNEQLKNIKYNVENFFQDASSEDIFSVWPTKKLFVTQYGSKMFFDRGDKSLESFLLNSLEDNTSKETKKSSEAPKTLSFDVDTKTKIDLPQNTIIKRNNAILRLNKLKPIAKALNESDFLDDEPLNTLNDSIKALVDKLENDNFVDTIKGSKLDSIGKNALWLTEPANFKSRLSNGKFVLKKGLLRNDFLTGPDSLYQFLITKQSFVPQKGGGRKTKRHHNKTIKTKQKKTRRH